MEIFLKELYGLKPPRLPVFRGWNEAKGKLPEVEAIWTTLAIESRKFPNYHCAIQFGERGARLVGTPLAQYNFEERFKKIKTIAEKRGLRALKRFFN